jgi:hypothetical protein
VRTARFRSPLRIGATAIAAVALIAASQSGPAARPPEAERRVRFTTHEGSWLSFDLSRDGRWIVMDLLGQVWRVPADGGTARVLTDAVRDTAELLDPAFSPDGKSILVHGEYRGLPGTFVMDTVGRAHRLTSDALRNRSEIGHNSAASSPDGKAVAVARQDSAGAIAVYEHDVATGQERRIAMTGTGAGDIDAPVYSADGREILFQVTPRNATTFSPGRTHLARCARGWCGTASLARRRGRAEARAIT